MLRIILPADDETLPTLRIILSEDDETLPTMGDNRSLRCARLDTLILRADLVPSRIPHVEYRDVVRFVQEDLGGVTDPLTLHLENVELCGERPDTFVTCFRHVANRDAKAWSYLHAHKLLNSEGQ
ncbi:hypothetical protein AURDEDRAFT_164546 [Auricularia subglabra TFB-10046 SS5]|nr:hypothetical protein AURDEDRAFT_164546 [Auricularia subglabra TFB-10046 SS5]